MTNNQIQFAKLQEDRRHNLISEGETARHNRRSEDVGYYTGGAAYAGVAENRRHNQEQESINWYTAENLGNLQAAQTSKTTSEVGVEAGKLGESTRHNKQTEYQASSELSEKMRHNKQTETQTAASIAETTRHNKEMEFQGDQSLTIQGWNAGVNTIDKVAESWRDVSQGILNMGKAAGAAGVASLFG